LLPVPNNQFTTIQRPDCALLWQAALIQQDLFSGRLPDSSPLADEGYPRSIERPPRS
jgi:hypothetical protein